MLLCEGDVGEPSTEVWGRIESVTIHADGSASYTCSWWDQKRLEVDRFDSGFIQESDDARYLRLRPWTDEIALVDG